MNVKEFLILSLKKTANTKENIQQFMWEEICMFRPELKTKTWKKDSKTNNNTTSNNNASGNSNNTTK